MRIIEPKHLREHHRERKPQKKRWPLLVIALILGVAIWQIVRIKFDAKPSASKSDSTQSHEPVNNTAVETKPRRLKTFTSEEFRNLYNTAAYPNTVEITSAPPISGNSAADQRIQALAFRRGYRLRSAPVAPLSQTPEGFQLQEKAVQPWQELKTAAAKDGVPLGLTSAFRSVEEQRLLFMQRLNATGASPAEIAAGESEPAVAQILNTTSIPGASRHHTGYTVDLKCTNQESRFFENTPCFTWLSKNNYENAKKFGWIPSYPSGTAEQGPEPEAWEYVWVGVDILIDK